MEVPREHQTGNQTRGPKKRTGTSKYDFFKVKVWLGDNMDHYYILSRFLICRMLTVTKIPYIKAVKIALETKKYLVDNNLTDITQAQLENVLFSIIRSKGFDEQYIDCYRMVTQFYQSRQPLCIIICGTAWTGKSTIAQQLASRINIPNVMQTDVIYELLRNDKDSPLGHHPLWCRPGLADAGLVGEFRREARVVHKGMEGDLNKTLSDGKPIIMEGMHLDPGLYIQDFGQQGIIMLPARPTAVHLGRVARPVAVSSAQRPSYKRSMTSASFGRADAWVFKPAANAKHHADRESTAVGVAAGLCSSGGTQFSRCVSADAELSLPEHSAVAADDAVGKPRPRSSGRNGKQRHDAAALGLCAAAGFNAPATSTLGHGEGTAAVSVGLTELEMVQGSSLQERQLELSIPRDKALKQQHQPEAVESNAFAAHCNANCSNVDACVIDSVFGASYSKAAADADQTIDAATISGFHQCMPGSDILNPGGSQKEPSLVNGTDISSLATPNLYEFETVPVLGVSKPCTPVAGWSCRSSLRTYADAEAVLPDPAPATSSVQCGSISPSVSPTGLIPSPPPVIMLEQLHVCAATAEAVALQQQALLQQHQHQRATSVASPGSPVSDGDTAAGVSPCISQEHSTTEVVSRQPSAGLPSPGVLSQEPSACEKNPWCECSLDARNDEATVGQCSVAGGAICSSDTRGSEAQTQDSWLSAGQCHPHDAKSGYKEGINQLPPFQLHVGSPQQQQDTMHSLSKDVSCTICSAAFPTDVSTQEAAATNEILGINQLAQEQQARVWAHASPDVQQHPMEQNSGSQEQHSASWETPQAATVADEAADGSGDNRIQGLESVTDKYDTASGSCAKLHHQKPRAQDHVQKPLFVPILVYMDEADHALMQEEASSYLGDAWTWPSSADDTAGSQLEQGDRVRQTAPAATDSNTAASNSSGSEREPAWSQPNAQEALRRMRLLQEYLCAYEAQGLPVVKVSYGNFSEALDKLHEYILQCIKVAMQL